MIKTPQTLKKVKKCYNQNKFKKQSIKIEMATIRPNRKKSTDGTNTVSLRIGRFFKRCKEDEIFRGT